MNRFFRAPTATYEAVRAQLDTAYGYPSDYATTCFQPVEYAPRDTQGRALLGVSAAFCEQEQVASVLAALLASGAVQEVDEGVFFAAIGASP